MEARVWFGIANELSAEILFGTSFMNRYVNGIFPSLQNVALRRFRLVYVSALVCMNQKEANPVGIKAVFATIELHKQDEKSVTRQTIMPPNLELFVLAVSIAGGLRMIKARILTGKREQVIFEQNVRNFTPLDFSTFPWRASQAFRLIYQKDGVWIRHRSPSAKVTASQTIETDD